MKPVKWKKEARAVPKIKPRQLQKTICDWRIVDLSIMIFNKSRVQLLASGWAPG